MKLLRLLGAFVFSICMIYAGIDLLYSGRVVYRRTISEGMLVRFAGGAFLLCGINVLYVETVKNRKTEILSKSSKVE